jgi:hypothetical protein
MDAAGCEAELRDVLAFFERALGQAADHRNAPAADGQGVGQRLTGEGLELIPGGFCYKEKCHELAGRPLQLLEALLQTPLRRATRRELRKALGIDDESVSYPDSVIIDAAKDLRKALRAAVDAAGLSCKNPLPSTGTGNGLAYRLTMP